MPKYIKLFKTYNDYIAVKDELPLPNVSVCEEDMDVAYYNPFVPETRLVVKYNVVNTSSPIKIGYRQYISGFTAIEIDGVEQESVVSAYTFSTTGEHTIKYTLTDPTLISDFSFSECSRIASVIVPNSVLTIGGCAFNECSLMTSSGTLTVPIGSTGYGTDGWLQNANYYLGLYNWTKVEQ